jgi:hypothetical protein
MCPIRREGDRKVVIDSWGGYAEQAIREAQARGDFDNLPGAGQPLDLHDNVFAAEWQSAFRMAKNAGAAPLWVELEKEIRADAEALQALLDRTARRFEREGARAGSALGAGGSGTPAASAAGGARGQGGRGGPGSLRARRRWEFGWPTRRGRRAAPDGTPPEAPPSPQSLEAERQRARALYLDRAAELDAKLRDYNAHRPRTLSWLEKPRLLPAEAARRFDDACPALVPAHPTQSAQSTG